VFDRCHIEHVDLVAVSADRSSACLLTRLVQHDDLFDVVLTQDPETVYHLADHLIRRMPMTDGDEIIRFDRGVD
jgi:hypothetical protein